MVLSLMVLLGSGLTIFALNPILPPTAFIPDGEPHVFELNGQKRVFLYGSRDERVTGYCGYGHDVWSAPVNDLTHWTNHGEILNVKQAQAIGYGKVDKEFFAAPDCVYNPVTKKYYLYTFLGKPYFADGQQGPAPGSANYVPGYEGFGPKCLVASSDSPLGPFDHPIMCDWPAANSDGAFDPSALVDEQADGSVRVYAFWGMRRGDRWAEIDPTDMHTIINGKSRQPDRNAWHQTLDPAGKTSLFEASSIKKVANDRYVFIYSSGEQHPALSYCYSKSPEGPWTYGGQIIVNSVNWLRGNNHGSIAEVNGRWYVFYHRLTSDVFNRQAMCEPIDVKFAGDKIIIPTVEMTSQGVETNGLNAFQRYWAGIMCWRTGHAFVDGKERQPDGLNPVVGIDTTNTLLGFKYLNFGTKAISDQDEFKLRLNLLGLRKATLSVFVRQPGHPGEETRRIEIAHFNLDEFTPKDGGYHDLLLPIVSLDHNAALQANGGLKGKWELILGISGEGGELCRLKEFAFQTTGTPLAVFNATNVSPAKSGTPPPGEPTNAKEAAKQSQHTSNITPDMLEREAKRKTAMTRDQLAWEEALEANLGYFYLPLYYKDKDAGNETAWDYVKDDPALPRMLMIGDSISRGYTLAVRHALAGKINVHRAPANCGPTASGLKNLDIWLGTGKWDIITWNFGIHDRKTDPKVYQQNLEVLLQRLQKTGAKIIWVRTTPAPPSGKNAEEFSDAQCEQVNRIADALMQSNHILEVDLYALMKPKLKEFQLPNNVHFKETGYQLMGSNVASVVSVEMADHSLAALAETNQNVRATLLPTLPPMPEIPKPLQPGSMALGDPKDFSETKMDFPIAAGPFAPTWDSINTNYHSSPAWLRDAKFGIWVHFGPQSAGQSGDWYARKLYDATKPAYTNHLKNYGHPSEVGYKDILHNWNPKKLNPAELVQAYHDAGARFLIIQGVHHDNFDNWNSHYQPWNSVNLGPHRDLLGEWSAAAKKTGMRFGVSFHHEYTWWWYQTAFGSDHTGPKAGAPYDGNLTEADGKGKWWDGLDPRMLYTINLLEYSNINNGNIGIAASKGIFSRHLDYAKWYSTWWALRIMDVIEQYDPDFIYTDGNSTQPFSGDHSGSGFKCDAAPRVVAHFYNHSLQKRGQVDTFSIIKFHPPTNGIVTTQEGTFPHDVKTDQPWIGENAVGDWFYAPDFTYDAGAVIRCLLEYVSRDGNYAVCVSLQPDGSLDAGSKKMLQEIGDWLRVNGEGIYGSKGWVKFGEGDDVSGKIKILPAGQLGRKQAEFKFRADDFRFTVGKDGSLYAWCLTMPESGTTLRIKSLGTEAKLFAPPIKTVALLGGTEKLTWRQTPEALEVDLPETLSGNFVLGLKISQ